MMRNLLCTLAALLLIFITGEGYSQSAADLKLPLDPEVKYGVFDNGMTYYIRSNDEPENRASFYMIQNVGAILEDDSQNGLAHFLEHMAFNGTKHFPEKGILNTLEKHGVKFGANINAYTSQDETVYYLSEVPTNKPGLLDTCLLVLNDWSNYLQLAEDEIEAERGVIAEEWRTRRDANFRLRKAAMPYVYNNSKYAERDIIGDLEVIKNFEYDALRDFYHDWYRTDLQAIAVVGDFDAEEMEKKVIALFSQIPAVEDPMEREVTMIPDNEELIFGVVTDREAAQSNISIYIRNFVENPGTENVEQMREDYVEQLFNQVMSQRIAELLQKGEPPFVAAYIARTSLTRNYDITAIAAIAKTNEEALALSAILEEVERVKRYGVTSGELERAKSDLLNRMENRVKEKDKITNDQYASEYSAHYLGNSAYMDIEMEFQIMQALVNSITPDDIAEKLPAWFSTKNNVMVISGPESEEVHHLSENEALAIFETTRTMEVAPYEDVEVATSLIETPIAPGQVVAEKEIPVLEAEEWTLSNGAKVVFRFADYEKDNISFRAVSPGGSSLYDADYIPSMEMLSGLVPFYGVGDFDQTTLQKMLTGKTVELNLLFGELTEGMQGSASPKDVETLMQLIHLRFTSPRFDEEAHAAITGRYIALFENMNKNPQKIMSDSLTLILTDYHPRTRVMDAGFIREVQLQQIQEVYTDRYSDASDFTFFFVGNIQKDALVPLVEQYIATLPSTQRKENWIDREVNEPEGRVEKDITMELSVPKSTVVLVFNKEMEYTPENLVMLRVIRGILDLRFIESIREEEGGTYDVNASTSLSHFPDEKANLTISFDTDPAKADYLKDLVYEELETLMKKGPSEKDLSKTVSNLLKQREEDRAHNSYWMNTLYNFYRHELNFNDPENFEEILQEMTVKDVKKAMKQLYRKANVVDLVFSPENVEEPDETKDPTE